MMPLRAGVLVTASAALMLACAPTAARSTIPTGSQAAAPNEPRVFKRVAGAAPFAIDFLPYTSTPGLVDIRTMVHPGLVVADDRGGMRPVVVEAVPSQENGLWKLLDGGRMETTWR